MAEEIRSSHVGTFSRHFSKLAGSVLAPTNAVGELASLTSPVSGHHSSEETDEVEWRECSGKTHCQWLSTSLIKFAIAWVCFDLWEHTVFQIYYG